MTINVTYEPTEYIAVWWWDNLTSLRGDLADWVERIEEWVSSDNYCELHQGELDYGCRHGDCS